MHKYWLASAAALTLAAVPIAAFAAKPVHPVRPATTVTTGDKNANHPAATPTVMYVLRGTLYSYTAATTTTPATVSVMVKSSNFEKQTLKSMTLTFTINSKTTVVLRNDETIANGDRGIIKVRAPKKAEPAALGAKAAFQVIDQGLSS